MADYSQLTPEDLLRVCANLGDVDAWNEFLRRFHKLVISVVIRTARRYTSNYGHLCDDLADEVYLRLCANGARALREFVPRREGSAYGYIKVIALNTVRDHFERKEPREVEGIALENQVAPDTTDWQLRMEDIDRILRQKANETEREVFWLYYLHGLTAKEIAAIPAFNLTVKGVESMYTRLGRMLRKELGVPPSTENKRKRRENAVSEGNA